MKTKLQQLIQSIEPIDQQSIEKAQERLDSLTKPPGSLGRLEDLACQLSGITRELIPDISKKAVIVIAADHGVCKEGVSAFPQEVTAQMIMNFLNGGAAVNVLARQAGADVFCMDVGVAADLADHPDLIQKKVKYGTNNMAEGPAMSEDEAIQAILAGAAQVSELKQKGYRVVATGDMGIGNTTASAAILAAMSEYSLAEIVGRGTGIDPSKLTHKQDVIARAIRTNKPDKQQPLDVLSKVGGLEIAGLAGVILGAAAEQIPVVVDGFISSAAALVAGALAPISKQYMIPSHLSHEQGHQHMLRAADLKPMLQLDMRLGEGTGAVLSFPLLDSAVRIMKEMATFEEANISGKSDDE